MTKAHKEVWVTEWDNGLGGNLFFYAPINPNAVKYIRADLVNVASPSAADYEAGD